MDLHFSICSAVHRVTQMEFNDARLYTPEESENSGTTSESGGSISESFEGSYDTNKLKHPGCAEIKTSEGCQGQGHSTDYQVTEHSTKVT